MRGAREGLGLEVSVLRCVRDVVGDGRRPRQHVHDLVIARGIGMVPAREREKLCCRCTKQRRRRRVALLYTDIACLQRGTGTPMATGVPVALLRRELELPYALVRAT